VCYSFLGFVSNYAHLLNVLKFFGTLLVKYNAKGNVKAAKLKFAVVGNGIKPFTNA
jgi:hypothetical protein